MTAPDPFLALRDQLDAIVADLRTQARTLDDEARELAPTGDDAAAHGGARVARAAATAIAEAIVRARPRCVDSSAYSEAWLVTCPGACGAILDYQRFLQGHDPGRFVDEDNVLFTCPRCGTDLEDVELPTVTG